MAFKHSGTTVVTNDRLVQLTNGGDISRPSSPSAGTLFYNTSSGKIEVYNGATWKAAITLPSAGSPALFSWGENTLSGKLGDNSTVNKSSPVSVLGGFTDWTQISAGGVHSIGLKANGQAWTWGTGYSGELGINTSGLSSYRSSPVSVIGYSDWVQVSAGSNCCFGVRADGTGWAWGSSIFGGLGIGTNSNRSSPTSIVGNFEWKHIIGGNLHAIGLRDDGTAWAWGYNSQGQLGDNSTNTVNSPVSVVGGFNDWVQVCAADQNSAGVRANGTVWVWGSNFSGQLGNNDAGNAGSRSSPISVLGGFTDWIFVSFRGTQHVAALRANGTIWTWGQNSDGALGQNNSGAGTWRSSPVSVVGGINDWVQVSTGEKSNLAIRSNGTLWGWGYNIKGQLGNDGTVYRSSPTSVIGGFSDWVDVSHQRHALGLRSQPAHVTTRPGNRRTII